MTDPNQPNHGAPMQPGQPYMPQQPGQPVQPQYGQPQYGQTQYGQPQAQPGAQNGQFGAPYGTPGGYQNPQMQMQMAGGPGMPGQKNNKPLIITIVAVAAVVVVALVITLVLVLTNKSEPDPVVAPPVETEASESPEETEDPEETPTPEETEDPEDTPTPTPEETETPASPTPKPAAPGDVLGPGKTANGPAKIEFVNYKDETAVFEHEVKDISLAPKADVDRFVEEIPGLAGMNVYYITVESHYVSGANLAYDSFFTQFNPIDANGNETQEVTAFGFKGCEVNSIPKDGTNPDNIITNCYIGAAPEGGNVPAGLSWTQYDTDYDKYDGEPAYLYPAG